MGTSELKVHRCRDCGDTFPAHAGDEEIVCPSCGSDRVEIASEPFL